MAHDLGPILSAAYPQVVATLIRLLGDMDRATDATQDALVKALQVWGSDGIPDNPVAWLVTVGRNRAVDQIRRDQRSVSYESNVVTLVSDEKSFESIDYDDVDWQSVDDDMLRLLFTCCHPAIPRCCTDRSDAEGGARVFSRRNRSRITGLLGQC